MWCCVAALCSVSINMNNIFTFSYFIKYQIFGSYISDQTGKSVIQKKISDPVRVRSDPEKKYQIESRNDLIQKKISDPKRVRSDPKKKYRIEIRNDLI